MDTLVTNLRELVQRQEEKLALLKTQLAEAEDLLSKSKHDSSRTNGHSETTTLLQQKYPFTLEEYKRYGRQMVNREIGLQGQLNIRKSSVLIIGLGGLGCPAASYLAGAGVGRLGLVDGDVVETSNLHRQILHSGATEGMKKVESAKARLQEINPLVSYEAFGGHLLPETAITLFENYDVILDCTDHPKSRYLISDAAVLTNKVLVTASALKTEGQLMVLNRQNSKGQRGPCYRCIFPVPPPAETIVSCGEGGIIGPVVGTMGVLMALETIKLLARPLRQSAADLPVQSMLLFSAYADTPFRTFKMRGQQKTCTICGDEPSISRDSLVSGKMDYAAFCGIVPDVNVLSADDRITAQNLGASQTPTAKPQSSFLLLDVRDSTHFDLARLSGSVNVPLSTLLEINDESALLDRYPELHKHLQQPNQTICAVCKQGNDSQLAIHKLRSFGLAPNDSLRLIDLEGGLDAWRRFDPTFPPV